MLFGWLPASTVSSTTDVGKTKIPTTFSSMIRIGFTRAVPKPGSIVWAFL
jgi:hypothetical protein